jgi:hypothetical protein
MPSGWEYRVKLASGPELGVNFVAEASQYSEMVWGTPTQSNAGSCDSCKAIVFGAKAGKAHEAKLSSLAKHWSVIRDAVVDFAIARVRDLTEEVQYDKEEAWFASIEASAVPDLLRLTDVVFGPPKDSVALRFRVVWIEPPEGIGAILDLSDGSVTCDDAPLVLELMRVPEVSLMDRLMEGDHMAFLRPERIGMIFEHESPLMSMGFWYRRDLVAAVNKRCDRVTVLGQCLDGMMHPFRSGTLKAMRTFHDEVAPTSEEARQLRQHYQTLLLDPDPLRFIPALKWLKPCLSELDAADFAIVFPRILHTGHKAAVGIALRYLKSADASIAVDVVTAILQALPGAKPDIQKRLLNALKPWLPKVSDWRKHGTLTVGDLAPTVSETAKLLLGLKAEGCAQSVDPADLAAPRAREFGPFDYPRLSKPPQSKTGHARLATSTDPGGWIAPRVLLQRLRDAGDSINENGLSQAMLRLAPDGRENLRADFAALPAPYGNILEFALGGELRWVPASEELWLHAGRCRQPRGRVEELVEHIDETERFFIEDASYSIEFEVRAYEWDSAVDISATAKVSPALAEIYDHLYPDAAHVGIWPANLDAALAATTADLLWTAKWVRSDIRGMKRLFDPVEPWTIWAGNVVLAGLLTQNKESALLAIDILATAIGDGRCFGDGMCDLVPHLREHHSLKLNRLADRLGAVAPISLLHTHACARLAQNVIAALDDSPPRDLGKLLGPLNEWLAELGEPCADSARPLLESLKGSSKAAKSAKAILARTTLDPAKRAEVNRLAAEVRQSRGDRLS